MTLEIPLNLCACCGSNEDIENHHIVPRFCGWFEETETIPLCEVHHSVLHNMLGKFFFLNSTLPKNVFISKLKEYSLWFCKFEWQNASKTLGKDREYFKNHCVYCRKPSRFTFWDYDSQLGLFGVCQSCMKWIDESYKRYWAERKAHPTVEVKADVITKEEGKGDKSI